MQVAKILKATFALTFCISGVSVAQNSAVKQSYTSADFVQFQPNTAQDMVSRLPGFTLKEGDDSARGFGQANLNILINGRRPSSKSQDAREILGRIPASNVERIEILDGAALDIPGLSGQVANITTTAGKLSGSWEYSARFEEGTQPQILEGEVSVNGTRGTLEYVASLNFGQFNFTEDGQEQFFDGIGVQTQERIEDIDFFGNRPNFNLTLTHTPLNGHVGNLNLSGSLFNRNFSNNEFFDDLTATQNDGRSRLDQGEDELSYEIGGDYAFPLGRGQLKLIGLYGFENSDETSRFFFVNDGQTPERSEFDNDTDEGEYILRSEYNWQASPRQDWQLALEGAFNFLDSTTQFSDDTGIDDPVNVRVEEERAEGNITHSWKLSDKLNLQTSAGIEYSQLDVTTGNDPARQFVRPKGFISASYDTTPRYTWRARLERGVGQLDFGTFVSSVNLSENFANGGNVDIVPTQFWDGSVEIERKATKGLSGTLRAFTRLIEDPIEQILFLDGSQGPGNLDSAIEYGLELNGTWILDELVPQGMRIEFEGGLRRSRIDDPITGEGRRINRTRLWDYDVTLRHDIPNTPYAWVVSVEQDRRSPFFRINESLNANRFRPQLNLTLTHKNIFGMTLDIRLQNILKQRIIRSRDIFIGDRSGRLDQSEEFDRRRGHRLSLILSDTF